MWIGDILQDILVELLNGNWLSIITFTNYNCFSLFMALLRDCYFSSPAAGELPDRRSLSSSQPMLLVGQRTGRSIFPGGESSSKTLRRNPWRGSHAAHLPWLLVPSPPAPPCLGFPGPGTIPLAALSERCRQSPTNAGAKNRAGITV